MAKKKIKKSPEIITVRHPALFTKARRGRKKNGRIDWDDAATQECLTLASNGGFHLETIARYTGLTPGQVQRRLFLSGFSVLAHRRGNTKHSQKILKDHQVK